MREIPVLFTDLLFAGEAGLIYRFQTGVCRTVGMLMKDNAAALALRVSRIDARTP